MNYNNYVPNFNGYNPNFYSGQSYPALQQTQLQNVLSNGSNASGGIVWVQGESGAKSFSVAPNNTVLLMDSEENKFYLKSADSSGVPLPLRTFDYTEVTKDTHKDKDDTAYVSKADFDKLKNKVEGLLSQAQTSEEGETDE